MSSFEIETLKALPPCHPQLVEAIITQIKSQGIFDDFRKSCLSDIDTKPSYLNLKQRVEGYVNNFLSRLKWSSTLQKNQLREMLRKDINESGLLKTGLDHLVDQLLYAQAENSIRPKVRAEIKKFLHLSDTPSSTGACAPSYSVAPPNYGPFALPPLPPVPPPPDVTGAMIDSFGGLKPPEPPSPHGSEYSVDMSDSSMVGRDEAPPAIPNCAVEKRNIAESEEISHSPMDLENNTEEDQIKKNDDERSNHVQSLNPCSSPEIFEEVSEGGSLGDTPVRDEEASLSSENESDQARTDFTGLFQENRAESADRQCTAPEVMMEDEDMVFELPEECVKTEEMLKNEDERAISSINDEFVSQKANVQQGITTASVDKILDDDNMQISSDEETQCVDEAIDASKKSSQGVFDVVESSSGLGDQLALVVKHSQEAPESELSDTQPPLQIDTDDSQLTVTDKNRLTNSQGTDDTTEIREDTGSLFNLQSYPENNIQQLNDTENLDNVVEGSKPAAQENLVKPCLEKCDYFSTKDASSGIEKNRIGRTTLVSKDSTTLQGKDFKSRVRKSSSQKSSSRSGSDRDRHREHRLSSSIYPASSSSSSSSKLKKVDDHGQKARDKDYRDKRDDRREKERDRKKDRDRRQRDSKHRSSSLHGSKKHSRHSQDRRRDDERKTHWSVSDSSSKMSQAKTDGEQQSDEQQPTAESVKPFIDDGHDHCDKSQQSLSERTVAIEQTFTLVPDESVEVPKLSSRVPPSGSQKTRAITSNALLEDDHDSELEQTLKKSKRKSFKQKDNNATHNSVLSETKEMPHAKTGKGKRRSSAASISSQQSAEALDQPESPVPSKFGRQRKINPKYEDDGTLSALLFGKN